MTGFADLRVFLQRARLLLTVVFCVSLWGAYFVDTRGTWSFVVEMRSDTAGVSQLFYDVGDGFTEADSAVLTVLPSSAYSTLHFALPDRHVRAIRFDPISAAGTFSIRSAYVIDGAGRIERRFASSDWVAANQIAARTEEDTVVTFATAPNATDPALHLARLAPASAPWLSARTIGRAAVQAWIALLMTVAVAAAGFAMQRQIEWAWQRLDRAASALGDARFLALDGVAIAWYLAIALLFVVLVSAGLHGSSLSLYAGHSSGLGLRPPVLGRAKPIRSDEWAAHTPAILNQVYRAKRFDVESSAVGPDSAALIANVPVRHFTTLFRPQFWGFFVLPPAYGFAFYWQFKAVLLLSGVFSLIMLLTRSSRVAAFVTLWFASSAYIQWTYSWPSLLPEMIGLFCLVMCSLFYMTVGHRRPLLIGAAILCVACAVNFALCAYIPHQIPLVWFGVFLCLWWAWSNRTAIFSRDQAISRAVALGTTCLAIALVMFFFLLDAEATLFAAADTEYPGRRSLPGGLYQIPMLFSHFFAYWTDDRSFPLGNVFGNICECSGFFWLAPVSAFVLRDAKPGEAHKKLAFGIIALFGVLLFVWLTVPLPDIVGSLTFMNKSGTPRSLHVLGLVNVSLVAIALSVARPPRHNEVRRTLVLLTAVGATLYPIFLLMNVTLAQFLSAGQLLLIAAYFTVVIVALVESRLTVLAALVIAPQIVLFALVNPVARGLHVVESSPIFEFVQSRPELLRGRWIVYSESFTDSGFLSAVGCEVVTGLRYLPDLKAMSIFSPSAAERSVLNRSGLFIARPSYGDTPVRFEQLAIHSVVWHANPLDARLRDIGVRYAAFTTPPPAHIAAGMRQLSATSVSGFWLYELPGLVSPSPSVERR